MPKFSVKKPFTVLVGVVLVLVLGFVSLTDMPTDLLPSINLPYLMVVTTYPGASPERVESELTAPLEASLGTVNGVENVTSTSSENYSMVMLEFDESTNMDSAMVKASTALNQLAESLPEMAGTPMLIEISPDMMATEYLAVDVDGMDIYELSEYTEREVIPALERVNGVARVSATGLVEQTVEVKLQQEMIDRVNDKLLIQVSDKLAEAKEELEKSEREIKDGLAELNDAQAELDNGQNEIDTQKAGIADQLREAIAGINEQIPNVEKQIADLETQILDVERQLGEAQSQLPGNIGDSQINNVGQGAINGVVDTANTVAGLTDQDIAFDKNLGTVKGLLRQLDDQCPDDAAMPASLAEAKGDRGKRQTMLASIQRVNALVSERNRLSAEMLIIAEKIGDINDNTELTDEQKAEQLAPLQQSLQETTAKRDELAARLAPLEEVAGENGETKSTMLANADAFLTGMEAEDESRLAVQAAHQQTQQLINTLNETLTKLKAELKQLKEALPGLNQQREDLEKALRDLEENPLDTGLADTAADLLLSGVNAQMALGQFQLTSGKTQLEAGQTQIEAAWEQYYDAREEALKNANLNQLLNMQTLAQMLSAQNFSMPAGYVQDADGSSLLLKVGDEFESIDDLKGALLCNIDGIGDVRLSDVATITLTDNADESYARVNDNTAVLLSIYKGSTASTSEVSDACNAAAAAIMQADPAVRLTTIMDQGDYIRLIVSSIGSSLLWGALLAIVVLLLFLRDYRPTLVVAISIPLSVLFAIVLMYFSGITLNIISLSGLSLGIGMLVDNSIVVIENIYRLRGRGVPAARAAVQGARQVSSAIIASTVTTICVFLPIVFTDGLTRELMLDMALTISYSLLASLAVALTVVPCAGSTLLKSTKSVSHKLFDKMVNVYGKLLRFCLRVKIVPLSVAIGLLVVCGIKLSTMGLVLIPEMGSNQLTAAITVAEDAEPTDAFATMDKVAERISNVDGVATIGIMSGGGEAMMGMGGEVDLTSYSGSILLDEDTHRSQKEIEADINAAVADLPCTVELAGSAAMDMSALSGSGVQVDITGSNLDTMLDLGNQVADKMREVEGVSEVSTGQESGDAELRVVVDKDKAMRLGLTVAQVYAELAQALTTESTSTTLSVGDKTYTVQIESNNELPNASDIFNHEFETTVTNADGEQEQQTHTLAEFASRESGVGPASITRENQSRVLSVTSTTQEGYTTNLLAREVQQKLQEIQVPEGYTVAIGGESTQINEMLEQMVKMLLLALVLIYLVMVAQFQSLLSPFIVLFTIPLAFTGGMIGLIISGETLSLMSLMGFLVLMGVVVNNGIVFVDYTNQLRLGGLPRRDALVATGKTRMRPILMTTMTTVLAMGTMIFGSDAGSEMGKGMAIVIVGGLLYATLMTLFIVPVIYDIMFKKPPVNVDIGDEGMDDLPDDAAEFAAELAAERGLPVPAATPAPAQEEDLFPDYPIESGEKPGMSGTKGPGGDDHAE